MESNQYDEIERLRGLLRATALNLGEPGAVLEDVPGLALKTASRLSPVLAEYERMKHNDCCLSDPGWAGSSIGYRVAADFWAVIKAARSSGPGGGTDDAPPEWPLPRGDYKGRLRHG